MSQRQVWIAAAALFALLCTVAVVVTAYRDRANTIAQLSRDTGVLAQLMAAHAEQGMANASATLERSALLIRDTDRSDPAAREELRERLDDLVLASASLGTVWAIDPAGMRWINNNDAAPALNDVNAEPYFRAHLSGDRAVHVGPTEIGTVLRRPRFTVSRPIESPGGDLLGVVVGGVDARFLELIYDRLQASDGVLLMAFNGDGATLAAAGPNDPDAVELARAAFPAEPGASSVGTAGDWYFASVRLASVPMILVAGNSVSAALSDWRERTIRTGLMAALMVAGFALLTVQGLFALRRESAALEALQAANEQLEARVRERTATVELLFRELNHRVKNNLQIIASLLRLQLRKSEDPATRAILQDSINRIFAIADVHGEIENAKNGAISLKSYIGKIAARICDAMRKPDQEIEVSVSVADAELSLDRAVLIAIAINETVTNAFKHAFATRTSGRLNIEVSMTDGRLVLSVHNDAEEGHGRAVEDTTGSGLGSSIIGMLVQQMQGTLAIEDCDGYTVRIEVPMA